MSAFSNYAEDAILDHLLRNVALTSPTTVYLALYESDPGENNTGTETAFTGYARQASSWSAAVDGSTDNSGSISFPANTGAQVTITHAAIFDAVTGGNMLIKGALTQSKVIETSDVLSFAANQLTFTLD